jgi:elongation factor P
MDVYLMMHEWNVLGVILPDVVSYKVVETTPGVKWDRAQAGTKPATLETGLVVQVPLYIEEGDEILLNTATNNVKWRA